MKLKIKKFYTPLFIGFLFLLATVSKTNAGPFDYSYQNPLNGIWSVTDWLAKILSGLQEIIALIAVAMIITSGIIYIFSGINSKLMTTAKNMATWAIGGFAIAIAIPSLLKEIFDIFKGGQKVSATVIEEATPITTILLNVTNFFLTIIGILALISFVVGGLQYLLSTGENKKTEQAKNIIVYSTIAILISGAGVIIINQIFSILEG